MNACIDRGLVTEGILPGGLKVRRRAPRVLARLQSRQSENDPLAAMDWVNAFAMAVNEENAAGGRVVTAPTNGAAGLVPAVGRYYRQFIPGASDEGLQRYLLTAGAIGILYKENASISGAEVGCQGEVGVACSMAAAGLAGALGGSNEEVEHAARNRHGASSRHDLRSHRRLSPNPLHRTQCHRCRQSHQCMSHGHAGRRRARRIARSSHSTMYQTGLDMQSRYKETSLAGLAVNVKDC